MNSKTPIKNILIVGGGTAGWLSAAFLAKTLGSSAPEGVQITLVESPDIAIIGVGEATFPSIRGTLAAIGIPEAVFLREANASYKAGIRFNHWVRPPGSPAAAGPDHYFHPFSQPSQRPNGPELLPYWLMGAAAPGAAFAEAVTMQKRVSDASRAPKRASDGDYLGPMNHAFHFDAARFADLLSRHARGSLGVRHELATVERVELDESGAIAGVVTRERGTLSADLYIDCTGFRGALMQALGVPFRDMNHVLFADRAMAMQVPYPRKDAPIAPYTIATAQDAGWIWDIGLQERRGIGYVFSSRYTDDAQAEAALRRYIGADAEGLEARTLKVRVGYRETPWVKNCVAIGLAGGFVEPLESSGIGLIETAAYLLGYLFPQDGETAATAKLFNEMMVKRYERIIDFVKMHFALTQRRDTPFWRDNADPASWTDSLRERLSLWRSRPPHRLDFFTDFEMYPPSSWQYVLYGMEFVTEMSAAARAGHTRFAEAQHEFRAIAQLSEHALDDLPRHRELVEQLCARAGAR